jgi:EmrB/QacA subfamily drug resistance transporter
MSETTAKLRDFRTVALIIASAMFMEQLDSTVLATALPAMAKSFHVAPLHMSLALTSYLISLAVFIPISGRVADRFGARRVFMSAIALFMFGSILCAQSVSLAFLVFARFLQGLGGAMMMPVGRLVLLRTVPKKDLVAAMTWLLVPSLIGPVAGPPVGGFIVTYLSWRWIFYINIPIGIAGIILARIYIEEIKEHPRPMDYLGFALSGVSLSTLVFAFELSSRDMAPGLILAPLFAIGILSGVFYLLHARRHPHPILDLRLLQVPTFGLSLAAGSLSRIAAGSMPFLLPLMMQLGFGMTAAKSGVITFTTAAGSMLMKAAASRALARFGFRRTMIWNAAITSAFIACCALFQPGLPLIVIYAVLLGCGFFQSLQFTAYNTLAYAEIPREQMSTAISFYTTFQQLMLSIGICFSATVLHASNIISGRPHLALADFSVTFLAVAAVSLLAAPVSMRLDPDAGEDMSGHRLHMEAKQLAKDKTKKNAAGVG